MPTFRDSDVIHVQKYLEENEEQHLQNIALEFIYHVYTEILSWKDKQAISVWIVGYTGEPICLSKTNISLIEREWKSNFPLQMLES